MYTIKLKLKKGSWKANKMHSCPCKKQDLLQRYKNHAVDYNTSIYAE